MIINSGFQWVGIGRHTFFEVKKAVGIVIDLFLRRGRQTDQERIEIFEDSAVLLVNRAVRFIDNDEIELTNTKKALTVSQTVDQPHHRWIGGDVNATDLIFFRDQSLSRVSQAAFRSSGAFPRRL